MVYQAVAVFDPKSSFNAASLSGYVEFEQKLWQPCTVKIQLTGFKPFSTHAIHIHEKGDLRKGCETLCGHFNPDHHLHGSKLIHGTRRHAGDLINNITSDSNGTVSVVFQDDKIKLYGSKYNILGRSVVIHSGTDDLGLYRETNKESATTGRAGSRIACSIIGIM